MPILTTTIPLSAAPTQACVLATAAIVSLVPVPEGGRHSLSAAEPRVLYRGSMRPMPTSRQPSSGALAFAAFVDGVALPSAVSIGDDPVRDLMDAHAAIPYAALEEVQRISAVLDEPSGPARIAAIRARLPADSLAELDAFMERVSVLPAEVRERALPGWGRPTAQGDDDLAEYGRLGERLGDGADALSDATGVLPWP